MLRIYDEFDLRNRVRIRRLSAVLLFVGGVVSGSYLSGEDSRAAEGAALPSVTGFSAPTLKLDERLRTQPQAASSPLAINLAFPPTAEVLTVSVRSETNRSR